MTTEAATSSTHRLTGDAVTVMEVIRLWHNETHTSSFETCLEQPCHATQRVAG